MGACFHIAGVQCDNCRPGLGYVAADPVPRDPPETWRVIDGEVFRIVPGVPPGILDVVLERERLRAHRDLDAIRGAVALAAVGAAMQRVYDWGWTIATLGGCLLPEELPTVVDDLRATWTMPNEFKTTSDEALGLGEGE